MTRTIRNSRDLLDTLNSADDMFVLFYASWCPFSQEFLPVFDKLAQGREQVFCRIAVDGNEDLFEEHAVDVYPTVIYFKGGQAAKRLDGRRMAGLREHQLSDLIESCGLDKG